MEQPERIERPTPETPETIKRGVTSDLLITFAEGAVTGAALTAGHAAAEQVIDAIKNRPEQEPSRIVLPPGVESDKP